MEITPQYEFWYEQAACGKQNWEATQPASVPHNPEVFFPRRAEGGQCAPAKSVCKGCPVKVECLKAGIREPFGVWGGLSEKERREAHRMNKRGVGLEEILAHFDRIEPKRRRKDALPTYPDVTHLIPHQRQPVRDEEEEVAAILARREAEKRRNGL